MVRILWYMICPKTMRCSLERVSCLSKSFRLESWDRDSDTIRFFWPAKSVAPREIKFIRRACTEVCCRVVPLGYESRYQHVMRSSVRRYTDHKTTAIDRKMRKYFRQRSADILELRSVSTQLHTICQTFQALRELISVPVRLTTDTPGSLHNVLSC